MTKTEEAKEIKALTRKCLFLWKAVAKLRAGGVCEYCGTNKRLNIHHIESFSTNKGLRFDLENALCLCATCHKFGRFSAHRSFVFVYLILTQKRPFSLSYLIQHRANKVELTTEYLLAKIEELEKMKEELNATNKV